jgi:hypothetical protein
MKILTTTTARKHLSEIVSKVRSENVVFGLGRHHKVEAIIMRFPDKYNPALDDATNLNANSASFDFLADEPDLYTIADLKKRYA